MSQQKFNNCGPAYFTGYFRFCAYLYPIAFFMLVGCSNNRFQLANRGEHDRQMNSLVYGVPQQNQIVPSNPAIQTQQPGLDSGIVQAPGIQVPPNQIASTGQPGTPTMQYDPNVGTYQAEPQNSTGALVQDSRLTDSPLNPKGPVLSGRVVNRQGLDEAYAAIQVFDFRSKNLVTQVASNSDGTFQVRNLAPNTVYELVAVQVMGSERNSGSTTAQATDQSVVIQLDGKGTSNRSASGTQLNQTQPGNQQSMYNDPSGAYRNISDTSNTIGNTRSNGSPDQPIEGTRIPIADGNRPPESNLIPRIHSGVRFVPGRMQIQTPKTKR